MTDIMNGLGEGLKQVYNILLMTALPLGVIALVICGIKILWGNQKSAEEGKQTIVRVVIAMAIIFLSPLIISTVSGWFQTDSAVVDQVFNGIRAG